ncbi:AlpA family transcriptional regulator [Maridesulfovibrio ferrireducens]|uniref:helix-turn-helix transcriptional regulator n=1 Tax=Maridesulfovibrio ferrireducens TaxID=246191 RepID=UPI001A33DD2A|nr:hypothetical protein [Maridesulfovibrio ferrireducens]MBI9112839.1 hypothetical protein [Maridesulfovibrio ferrireducens]
MSLQLLNEKKVSEMTGYSLSKIRKDRHFRRGMPYVKLGKSVRYLVEDVEKFVMCHRVDPNVERVGGGHV